MKCSKCGVDYSERVYRIHIKRCEVKQEIKIESKEEIISSDELEIESEEYTLEELLQMALDNPNRRDAPSTIKRWTEERLRKELGL